MKYRALFKLRLVHPFHPDGRCTEFGLGPAPETAALLINHRCLCRILPDGLVVLAEVDPASRLLLSWVPHARCVFRLRLLVADFPLYTQLESILAQPAPYFTHAGPEGAPAPAPGAIIPLTLQGRTASGSDSFWFPAQVSQAKFVLGGSPLAGAEAAAFGIEGLGADSRLTWEPKTKSVTVTAATSTQPRRFLVRYPIRPRLPNGIFAEVEIRPSIPAVLPPEGAPEYRIVFEARSVRWKYLLVTDVPAARDTFSIEASETVKFTRSALDAADPVGRALLEQYPPASGFRIGCFLSDVPIPCKEKPLGGIKLKLGEATVVPSLPAPAWRNVCSVGDQPGLYHVLERVAKP